MNRDHASVRDILHASQLVLSFVGERNKNQLCADELVFSAVVRQLEIVGEATKRLSNGFRCKYSNVPWTRMAGLRDRLMHG